MALPMPRPAPVTRAVRLVKVMGVGKETGVRRQESGGQAEFDREFWLPLLDS
jgi:hypothetical protein